MVMIIGPGHHQGYAFKKKEKQAANSGIERNPGVAT
jgi:hypothetical protein